MNTVFKILMCVSFVGAFAVGFLLKRYWSLVLSFILGLAVAAFSFWLFIVSPETKKVGLGIIALIPAVAILLGVFNVFSSLLGGLIGIFLGKRRARLQVKRQTQPSTIRQAHGGEPR